MNATHGGQGAGIAAMAACAALWSLAGIFIKLLDWNPFAIACGRSLVAAVFLLVWLRRPKITFSGAQVGAALANAATMLLFIYANKATSSANAILLQYGSPIYVAIIGAVVLKERPRAEHWAAFAAVAAGMALFFSESLGGGRLAGDLAAAAAGLTFAIYFIFMRMQKDGSPLESNLLAHALAASIAFAVALFLPAPRLDAPSLGAIAALGIFQIGLAALLFVYGIKRVSAVQAVLVSVVEPVLNPIWVFLGTGEAPGPRALAGGAIIVTAVALSSIVSVRRLARGGP